MKMTIETPNFRARKGLLSLVFEKVGKLENFSDSIMEAKVYLKIDHSGGKENKSCEIKLIILGNDLFAAAQSDTFEDALHQNIASIKHRIERWKTIKNRGLYEKMSVPEYVGNRMYPR